MNTRRIPLLVLVATAVIVATATGTTQPWAESAAITKPKPGKGGDGKPKPTDLSKSKDLWATINVCDTADNPNTIGIRGSMPGLGNRSSKLEMRFRVQYRTDGEWKDAQASSDSGWQPVGHTIRQVIESGQNFTFLPPTDGGAHQLRGSVRFRWLRDGKTKQYQQRYTEAGHTSTAGADPKRFSAATCKITSP